MLTSPATTAMFTLARFTVAVILATLLAIPARAQAKGGEEFTIAQVQYTSLAAHPDALASWLFELERRTSVHVAQQGVAIKLTDAAALARYPFLVLSGGAIVPTFSGAEIDALRRYLTAGGTLFIDNTEGPGGRFEDAAHALALALFPDNAAHQLGGAPDRALSPIAASHVIFKSFYLIDHPVGRVAQGELEGVVVDGRLAIIYSPFDLLGAFARGNGSFLFTPTPNGDTQREMAFRFAVNIVMYVLCLDYKDDQVHVPFILRRRQWRP